MECILLVKVKALVLGLSWRHALHVLNVSLKFHSASVAAWSSWHTRALSKRSSVMLKSPSIMFMFAMCSSCSFCCSSVQKGGWFCGAFEA